MIALDLDGTLLNSDHQVTQDSADYLRKLSQQPGTRVVLATGRPISTVYSTIQTLLLEPDENMDVVCSNGAQGYSCRLDNDNAARIDKTQLFSTTVPRDITLESITRARARALTTMVFVGDHVYVDATHREEHRELIQKYQTLSGCQPIYVKDAFQKALLQGEPSTILVFSAPSKQEAARQAFQSLPCKVMHFGWFTEILAPGVDKGNGLLKLCRHRNIPPQRCIAFGDGTNDIEFLQVAGRGVAMKNSKNDRVKEIADEVTEHTNDEDGVILHLQSIFNGLLVPDARK